MIQGEFYARVRTDLHHLVEEMRTLVASNSTEKLRVSMGADAWTAVQILEHLCLAHEPYLTNVTPVAQAAPPAGEGEVPTTWLGRLLVKRLAQPGGVGTIPRMQPSAQPELGATVARWRAMDDELLAVVDELDGKDLSGRFHNPFLPAVRLTLADFLGIYREHLRYHRPQLQARLG